MRITTVLYRQHIGFMFKKHWQVQGKRRVLETGVEASLLAKGIKVADPKEYFASEKPRIRVLESEIGDLFLPPKPQNENHPDYKARGLFVIGDSNVIVEGVPQAQSLLKTLVFHELPRNLEERFKQAKLPADIERSFQQSVLVSHLLDAEQQKTVKIVNPLRPMRPYPRNYGITEARKNLLLSTRLINHCERYFGHQLTVDRKTLNDAFFITPFTRDGDHVQLEITAETFMTSRKPIRPFKAEISPEEHIIPDIFPIRNTLSIPETHFYDDQSAYPIKSQNQFSHPHTILLHHSGLDVKNLFGTPITPSQFESRAMLKGFAVAASRAQSLYGKDVKMLDNPVVVQVVQIESKKVQFGIFQLNTLDLDRTDGVKNYWFRKPEMQLYEDCCYNNGRPALTSYNFDVLRMMSVFYNN